MGNEETDAPPPVHDESSEDPIALERARYFNIYALRHKWASRFTSVVFTHGASSTQRGEGVFSEVKRRICGGLSLIELYEQLDDIVERKIGKHRVNL